MEWTWLTSRALPSCSSCCMMSYPLLASRSTKSNTMDATSVKVSASILFMRRSRVSESVKKRLQTPVYWAPHFSARTCNKSRTYHVPAPHFSARNCNINLVSFGDVNVLSVAEGHVRPEVQSTIVMCWGSHFSFPTCSIESGGGGGGGGQRAEESKKRRDAKRKRWR